MGNTSTNTPADAGLEHEVSADEKLLDLLLAEDEDEEGNGRDNPSASQSADEEGDDLGDGDAGKAAAAGEQDPEIDAEEKGRGYLRHSDYTQKTQLLAEERRALEAEKAQIAQARQQYLEALNQVNSGANSELSKFKNVNWVELKQTDPEEYVLKRAEYQEAQERISELNKVKEQETELQQQEFVKQFNAMAQQENAILSGESGIPGWADPDKGPELRKALKSYALNLGYQEQEVSTLIDHRAILVLDKARRYDELVAKSKGLNVKLKQKTVPKVVRPGASQGTDKSADTAARRRLKETGSVDDAAAAIFHMLDPE